MNPARLKAFVLDLGDGPDVEQARAFLEGLGFGLFLEPIEAILATLDVSETIRLVEDYKPLDIDRRPWRWRCAAAFARAIPNGGF